jgi:LAO/AO transport system kinase
LKAVKLLYPHTGKAYVIGVTGSAGCGKSTLIYRLASELRKKGKTVGVVAIDPTSSFSGGALLGDRIRMQNLSTDEGVYIRSMATRGTLGGLARATADAVRVLDASGKDVVFVETSGAGQSEVDVVKVAHTVLVVVAPGLGDDIQASKAGMMEIGDIFIVNKADRDNADKAVEEIQAAIELGAQEGRWRPPVIKTTASSGRGTENVIEKIEEHKEYLNKTSARETRVHRCEIELAEALKYRLTDQLMAELRKDSNFAKLVDRVAAKKVDPYSAADRLVSGYVRKRRRSRRKP